MIATAGIAALVAGAFSMAGGEYVSVSTQRDTEKALIAREKWELATMPVTVTFHSPFGSALPR